MIQKLNIIGGIVKDKRINGLPLKLQNELLSIIENSGRVGLQKAIELFKAKSNEKGQ